MHRQLRALTILDGLIENAGPRFQRSFADEALLERLRVLATDPVSDEKIRNKCQILFRQWATDYKSTPGLERIANLHKQLPKRKQPVRQEQSWVLRETQAEANQDVFEQSDSITSSGKPQSPQSPTNVSSSSTLAPLSQASGLAASSKGSRFKLNKDNKKNKPKPFNLEKEKPLLLQAIATSSVASTNLLNVLKLINRENKRVSEDPEAIQHFETCKQLRRQILRYIQQIESEQWLGSLIHANEELVTALMAFEVLDKSLEDDSDSDDNESWTDRGASLSKPDSLRPESLRAGFAGLTLQKDHPPRMRDSAEKGKAMSTREDSADDTDTDDDDDDDDDHEDDPFADRNAIHSTKLE